MILTQIAAKIDVKVPPTSPPVYLRRLRVGLPAGSRLHDLKQGEEQQGPADISPALLMEPHNPAPAPAPPSPPQPPLPSSPAGPSCPDASPASQQTDSSYSRHISTDLATIIEMTQITAAHPYLAPLLRTLRQQTQSIVRSLSKEAAGTSTAPVEAIVELPGDNSLKRTDYFYGKPSSDAAKRPKVTPQLTSGHLHSSCPSPCFTSVSGSTCSEPVCMMQEPAASMEPLQALQQPRKRPQDHGREIQRIQGAAVAPSQPAGKENTVGPEAVQAGLGL